jgi:hypothetical protein
MCCCFLGCGPNGATKENAGTTVADQTSTAKADFDPKDFKASLAWVKAIRARAKGADNPLVRKEAIEKGTKEFERVNGTRVEWQFPVTALHGGEPPSVEFDGNEMRFGDNIVVSFSGGPEPTFPGRVFLKMGKQVSETQYRTLKAGSLATVKGVVRMKFSEFLPDSVIVDIIIEDATMQ